jgi:opacity protein-like surface antigen
MKIMKKLTLITAFTASFLTLSAQAENYYIEGSLGNTKVASESGNSFGVLGGYKFYDQDNVKVSAELGYNKYIEIEADTIFGKATAKTSSIAVGSKLSYSPVQNINVFSRIAYETMIVSVDFLGETSSGSSNEFTYALGASYDVAQNFSLGTQYKYSPLEGSASLSNVTVSGNYRF